MLREQWATRFPDSRPFPREDQLIPVSLPASPRAQSLVTRIENTLRNLMTLTPVIRGQGDLLQQAFVKGESLYDRASLRRDMDEDNHDSLLIARPLASFLETGDLIAVLNHGTFYSDHFANIFPNKSELTNWFEEFSSLRNAVAHNKVLSIQALDELSRKLEFLENHLGKAAAKRLKEDATGEVLQEDITLISGNKGSKHKIIGKLSANRRLEVDFRGQAYDADGKEVLTLTRRVLLEAGKVHHVEIPLEPSGSPLQPGSIQIQIIQAQPRKA